MPGERPDIKDLLERELAYHKEQVRRCEAALAALRGGIVNTPASAKTIGWAAAIDELFESLDPGVELSVSDVWKKLGDMGLPIHEDQARGTVQTTLARKAGKTIERASVGRYRKKRKKGLVEFG